MAAQKRRSDCPISYALDLFGDRWSLLIIRDIMFKSKSNYGEFLRSEEKIATNILADRLAQLEMAGLIFKTEDPEHGSKFIYKLSTKGIDLLPILIEVIIWSAKYDADSAVEMKFVNRAKREKQNLIRELTQRLKKEMISA
jgi:DNA-binding HxlR family transcriptional regulator